MVVLGREVLGCVAVSLNFMRATAKLNSLHINYHSANFFIRCVGIDLHVYYAKLLCYKVC